MRSGKLALSLAPIWEYVGDDKRHKGNENSLPRERRRWVQSWVLLKEVLARVFRPETRVLSCLARKLGKRCLFIEQISKNALFY